MNYFLNFCTEWLTDVIKTSIEKATGERFEELKIKKLQENLQIKLQDNIINNYQNEIYYNSLDKFLNNRDIFLKLINICFNSIDNEDEGKKAFADRYTEEFININKNLLQNKTQINTCLYDLYAFTFSELNPISEEYRSIINILYTNNNENTNKIIYLLTKNNEMLLDEIKKLKTNYANILGLTSNIVIPHWLTLQYPNIAEDKYVTRKEENEIYDKIIPGIKLLITSPMGGIGKTTFLQAICKKLHSSYHHVAWVRYTGNIEQDMIQAINIKKCDNFSQLLRFLMDFGQELFLCIDNVDDNETSKVADDINNLRQLKQLPGTLIITSRQSDILDMTNFIIDYLDEDGCVNLFQKYYGMITPTAIDTIKAIIKKAGRHTLAIEIIAKTANKQRISSSEMLEKLNKQGFDLSVAVATEWNCDNKAKMLEQMQKLYSITDLNGNDIALHILKNFSILPYIPLSGKDTRKYLHVTDKEEQSLADLCNTGWLESTLDGSYTIHPVIREVVINSSYNITFADCQIMIRLFNEDYVKTKDYFKMLNFLPFLLSISETFSDVESYINLSNIYLEINKLQESLIWQQKALIILEKLYPEGKHQDCALSYNNLSMIYKGMENLSEALKWQKKSIDILKKLLQNGESVNLIVGYNNLAMIYYDMDNVQEAFTYQNKAIFILEKQNINGIHADFAASFNNMSLIYKKMGNIAESLKWQKKAVDMTEKLYPDGLHPSLAICYNNISALYINTCNLPEAITWQKKAVDMTEKLYPDGCHPLLAKSYNTLASIHKNMNNFSEAIIWQQKGINILEKLYSDGICIDLATSYNNLSTNYYNNNEFTEALKSQKKCITILENIYPDGIFSNLAISYNNLFKIYRDMGNEKQAEECIIKKNLILQKLQERDK